MLLGFEDYKYPSASPSVSSPDSHNSDSSVEVGDRRNSMLRHGLPPRESIPPPPFNKELFLPLSFPVLQMPPPGFRPSGIPSHLMFPGYHPSLYAQHQGLLKPVLDAQSMMNASHHQHMAAVAAAAASANNNSRFVPNHNNNKTDEQNKRFYLDVVLKKQQGSATEQDQLESNNSCKDENDDAEIDNEEDLEVSMTPPRSPPLTFSNPSTTCHSVARLTQSTTPPSMTTPHPSVSAHLHQDIPIDLSMKTGSSCGSDDARTMSPGGRSDTSSLLLDDSDRKSRRSSPAISEEVDDEDGEFMRHDAKRIRLTTTPLDLTTKV